MGWEGVESWSIWKAQEDELYVYHLTQSPGQLYLRLPTKQTANEPFIKFHAWTQAPFLLPPRKGPEPSLVTSG